MRMTSILASATVLATLAVGCEKASDVKAPAAPATPAMPATPAAPATPAVTATPAAAVPATPAAPAIPATPATPATPAAPVAAIPPAPDAAAVTAPAGAAAAVGTEDAQKMLDQAVAYIKDNKLDLADTTLTKLEGVKASLPESLQKGIDNARSMLTAAKAGGGIKIPSLGGK